MSVLAESSEAEFLPTRQSLLERLKNLEDQEVWREFFDLYWRLIYGVAVKAGCPHVQAEDIVQETIIAVAKNIANFRSDPAFGSFKSWLLTITHRRMKDLRRRAEARVQPVEGVVDEEQEGPPSELEQLWDAEWKEAVRNAALEKLKRQVPPKHFQIFFLHVVKEVPAFETARVVGVNIAQVYLLKHRLARLYAKCLEQAETQLDA